MRPFVGASLLAKIVNDNAGILNARGALGFFASKLAPTGAAAGDRSASIFSIGLQLPQRHPPLYGAGQNNRGLAEPELRHPVNQVFQLGH